jgi:DNA-binding CsgD family transcriptional regulator
VARAAGGPVTRDLVARLAATQATTPLLRRVLTASFYLLTDQPRKGVPLLREVIAEFGRLSDRHLAHRACIQWWFHWMADTQVAHAEAAALVRDCRAQGAIGLLPRAQTYLARAEWLLSSYHDVQATADEGLRIARDTNQPHFAGHLSGLLACVAAVRGDEDLCRALTDEVLAHGLTEKGMECLHALNLLDLGLGRYDVLLQRADGMIDEGARDLIMNHVVSLPDYVEATVRSGQAWRADDPCTKFEAWAEATDRPWVKAVALRCRAVIAEPEDPVDLYERSIDLHLKDGPPFERARTHLLYGSWLRRQLRRNDAKPHLRTALKIFEQVGATPWAHRARSELRAAGEASATTPRGPDLLDRLTPQELQVARLAAEGLSNRDIAAQLILSPRTVGYHLYKTYPKLGITSRHELSRMDLG